MCSFLIFQSHQGVTIISIICHTGRGRSYFYYSQFCQGGLLLSRGTTIKILGFVQGGLLLWGGLLSNPPVGSGGTTIIGGLLFDRAEYYTVPTKCDPSVAWLTTSRHNTGVDFSGRDYYSNLKGMCLPLRKMRVIFCTQWVYLQAAVHLSQPPTHEDKMPLSLKSFLSTSSQPM